MSTLQIVHALTLVCVRVWILRSIPYLTIREEASPLIACCNPLISKFNMSHSRISFSATAALTLESCYTYLSWSSGTARDADAMIRMTVLTAKQMHDRCAYARWMHIYSHYIRQDSDSLDPSRRCRPGPMICKD
jgi:hypothetical protein